mgnify:CR=1 FL=1
MNAKKLGYDADGGMYLVLVDVDEETGERDRDKAALEAGKYMYWLIALANIVTNPWGMEAIEEIRDHINQLYEFWNKRGGEA